MPAAIVPQPPFRGFLLAVGGQARKVGKSALVVDILREFPNWNWTAVKITPYVESGCPLNGPSCRCAPDAHTFAIRDEHDSSGSTDTSRFLAAGARRALWVQTKQHHLRDALPSLAADLAGTKHVIVESDALVQFWKPTLYVMVLDPANPDFKASARENLALADVFVFRSPINALDTSVPAQKPKFFQPLGAPLPMELRQFLSGIIS